MAIGFIHRLACGALIVAACLLSLGPARAQAPAPRLFGSLEFIGGSLKALPQWTRVLAKIRWETAIYDSCARRRPDCPSQSVTQWQDQVRLLEGLDKRRQLNEVNRYFNRWTYRLDSENYGLEDYWATPLEFVERSGDCEDYAIIKYVSLKALGFPPEKMRIVVVRDVVRNIAHAILAVYQGNDIIILDSLLDGALSHRYVTYYAPQYSVNEKTRWAHIMTMRRRR